MLPLRLAATMAALMVAASVLAWVVRPSVKPGQSPPSIQLQSAIPLQFGPWREAPPRALQVVNPQTQALIDKIYSQTLTRIYVNDAGYRIMLSVAYGDDQRGGLQAHRPEVCYPAQGFEVMQNQPAQLSTPFGSIASRRLDTQLGSRREPVTYWIAFADTVVRGRFERRLAEIRLGLTGQVPSGLVFRVSSIDTDVPRAYREQERFVSDLLAAVTSADRLRLAGLGAERPGAPAGGQ